MEEKKQSDVKLEELKTLAIKYVEIKCKKAINEIKGDAKAIKKNKK